MAEKKDAISRRNFLKTAGVVGVGSLLSPLETLSDVKAKFDSIASQSKTIPTRPFGKTGAEVPILGLGAAVSRTSDLFLKQALNMGVNYWDTAPVYAGGKDEKAIGQFFTKFPEDRKKVFLATKTWSITTDKWSYDLDTSLKRMNTSYIDLYLIHSLADIRHILPPYANAQLWAEKAQSEGKIRFFGFSTHVNIQECLIKASKLDWIDGIMFSYNFRTMHVEEMKKAVDACTKAGIGLVAMKTQASGWMGIEPKIIPDQKEQVLFDQLAKKGLTIEQAKLKTVWDDSRIACICSHMPNMTLLMANVDAALNNKKLSLRDKHLFEQYARQTASTYCTGCSSICEPEVNNEVPISDIMRFLMYARCYGEPDNAKSQFNGLPIGVRKRMAHIDYTKAEQKCPQRMEIGRLMREATTELV